MNWVEFCLVLFVGWILGVGSVMALIFIVTGERRP